MSQIRTITIAIRPARTLGNRGRSKENNGSNKKDWAPTSFPFMLRRRDTCTFDRLPNVLLSCVLVFLPNLPTACAVNKHWSAVARDAASWYSYTFRASPPAAVWQQFRDRHLAEVRCTEPMLLHRNAAAEIAGWTRLRALTVRGRAGTSCIDVARLENLRVLSLQIPCADLDGRSLKTLVHVRWLLLRVRCFSHFGVLPPLVETLILGCAESPLEASGARISAAIESLEQLTRLEVSLAPGHAPWLVSRSLTALRLSNMGLVPRLVDLPRLRYLAIACRQLPLATRGRRRSRICACAPRLHWLSTLTRTSWRSVV